MTLLCALLAASALAASGGAQSLPVTSIVLPDRSRVAAELALTPAQQEKGLMFRTEMADGQGMLFVFSEEQLLTFWMKNTWMDLDMVFIGADKRVTQVHSKVPRSYPDTPESKVATAAGRGLYVLELPAGSAALHKIRQGSLLKFNAPAAPKGAPSAGRAEKETVGYLKALIGFDTRNPPGAEAPAARYIAEVLAKEGVEAKVYEAAPGRASVVARLRGSGKKAPLLLLSHLDTVGFERARWGFDPLKATVKDGYLYGRGAVDNKGLAAVELAVFLAFKRSGRRLDRDLILAAVADEETGGERGTRWLLAKHPSLLKAEYAINEGGATTIEGGRLRSIGIQAAEKAYHDLRLRSRGTGGHSSAPLPDNPILSLSQAIASLKDWQAPYRLNPVTRAFFEGIAPFETAEAARAIRDLLSGEPQRERQGAELLSQNPRYNSMLRDTLVPTMLQGGFAANVIPSQAEANLNCRLLPDTDAAAFVRGLRDKLAPYAEVEEVQKSTAAAPPLMPSDSELFLSFAAAAKDLAPDAVVLPYMSSGATDSEYLRRAGVKAYGFDLPLEPADHSRMHGDDERVPLGALGWSVIYLYKVIEGVME